MALINNYGRNEEEDLINQIEQEMRKIHLSVEKLHNNISLSETNDPIEKCLISNYCYSLCLLEKGINGGVERNNDPLKKFEDSLQQEVEFLSNDLDRILRKMNEYNELLSRIDKNTSNLNEMMETATETNPTRNINDISKHVKMRFKKEKSDLKAIISGLFSDNSDIQDLIARIIEHHFAEGSDKYLQLEDGDNIIEQIELLRRTRLFDINPHDILQIKLADLI